MTKEQKQWIDNASYEELLRKWRFEPAGSPWFQNRTGQYFQEVFTPRNLRTNYVIDDAIPQYLIDFGDESLWLHEDRLEEEGW